MATCEAEAVLSRENRLVLCGTAGARCSSRCRRPAAPRRRHEMQRAGLDGGVVRGDEILQPLRRDADQSGQLGNRAGAMQRAARLLQQRIGRLRNGSGRKADLREGPRCANSRHPTNKNPAHWPGLYWRARRSPCAARKRTQSQASLSKEADKIYS